MNNHEEIAILSSEDVRKLEGNAKFRNDYYVLYPKDAAKFLRADLQELAGFIMEDGFPILCRIGIQRQNGQETELRGFQILDLIRWAVRRNRAVNLNVDYMDYAEYSARLSNAVTYSRRSKVRVEK